MTEGINSDGFDFGSYLPATGASAEYTNASNQEQAQESIFFTPENLAQAGKDSAYSGIPKVFAQEAADIFSQYGVEAGNYDLLDDETGLVKGSREDFETAAAMDALNATFNEDYKPRFIEAKNEEAGVYLYTYDSDGNGSYETHVAFYEQKGDINQSVQTGNGQIAINKKDGEISSLFHSDKESGKTVTYRTSDNQLEVARYEKVKTSELYGYSSGSMQYTGSDYYQLEYNPDGSLKNMKKNK